MARSTPSVESLEKSGERKKRTPLIAFGSETERSSSARSRMNSSGIRIFDQRSIPFFTPQSRIPPAANMKAICAPRMTPQALRGA